MGSRKLSQRSSLGLRELHLKTKHCLDSCEVWGNRSIEFKAVIKSSKSALLGKMQTGFGVKRLSQTLSSSTDNLVLAFRLFWGCTLPVHILCVFRARSLRGVPCLSPAALVTPGWLPASSLHILENMRGPCIGKAVCLSAWLLGWGAGFNNLNSSGLPRGRALSFTIRRSQYRGSCVTFPWRSERRYTVSLL